MEEVTTTSPDYITTLKGARVEIDHSIQHVDKMRSSLFFGNSVSGGREVAIAYTKLQEAKMWIGKALEQQGHELPREFQDKSE